jgi:ribonucleoside-diphosphate reductase alpha chain
VAFTDRVFRTINEAAYNASAQLAEDRGPFPAYTEQYLDGEFIQRLPDDIRADIKDHGIRNCFLTSQAPTGTIAKLAGVWAGIEPYFSRETRIENRLGSHNHSAPDSEFVVTADEITPGQHIAMMAAAQRHIDSAVSKTVNAPEWHTLKDTAEVYGQAYDMGCKSVAYYRDGSRAVQVQYVVKQAEEVVACAVDTPPGECVTCS